MVTVFRFFFDALIPKQFWIKQTQKALVEQWREYLWASLGHIPPRARRSKLSEKDWLPTLHTGSQWPGRAQVQVRMAVSNTTHAIRVDGNRYKVEEWLYKIFVLKVVYSGLLTVLNSAKRSNCLGLSGVWRARKGSASDACLTFCKMSALVAEKFCCGDVLFVASTGHSPTSLTARASLRRALSTWRWRLW